MDTINVRFRMGFSGYCKGVPVNPDLRTEIEQVFGPEIIGAGYQFFGPVEGVECAAGEDGYISLIAGFDNPLNEEIVNDEAFDRIHGIVIHHLEESEASLVYVFGGPNADLTPPGPADVTLFQGPWTKFARAALRPGDGIAMWSRDGWPVNGEFTGGDFTTGDGTNAYQIYVKSPGASNATIGVGILGAKPQ